MKELLTNIALYAVAMAILAAALYSLRFLDRLDASQHTTIACEKICFPRVAKSVRPTAWDWCECAEAK